MATKPEIAIRNCSSLDDFRQCVAVQKAVWGFEDADLVPLRLFVVAQKIEGQILGAFKHSGHMAGFALAVPALKGSKVYLHSHMVGVLSEFQGQGIGRRLKLEQRRKALKRGINLIEWTFDPLELKNAYFNLERLGAIARRYVENQYGTSSSPLHRGLPTDRLIVEWWLDSPRVIARTKKTHPPESGIRRRIAVPTTVADPAKGLKVSVSQIQTELRDQFQDAFSAGLAAVGFEVTENVGTYLLGKLPAAKRA
jgi:predicted GNAT superfamily acetyltransferase